MGFRIHRGIFQKLNAERTAYENTFKIDDDGRIKEVDADGNVTSGYLKIGEQASDADTVDGIQAGSFLRSDTDDETTGALRVNKNWGAGFYTTEQFTIRGTYPSMTLRSTTANNKWLFHSDASGKLQFYEGDGTDNNTWDRHFEFDKSGNFTVVSGNITTVGTVYADVFSDRNNTSYYLDPASISYLNDLRPNIIYDRNDTNYYLNLNGDSKAKNFRTTGEFFAEQPAWGGFPLAPNLIHNSYMNKVTNGVPNGWSVGEGTGYAGSITIEAVSPWTHAFEGPYVADKPANAVDDPNLATESNPYWFGRYYNGPRIGRGGMRSGWHSQSDGKILKVTGSGVFSPAHCAIFPPKEENNLGAKWLFSCFVKIVKGSVFKVGTDAGYRSVSGYTAATKEQTDAGPQGWIRVAVMLGTSQITRIDALAMSMAILPDENGDIEGYIALPYLANATYKGTNYDSWSGSVLDKMERHGFYIHPSNGSVEVSSGTFTIGGNQVATQSWVGSQGYLTSVPSTYATTSYVDTAVSNLVDSAPGALNTLNELAAALGDDANFSTTVTNAIAAKADASHTHGIGDINDAPRWWNNFGDNHTTRTSFDAENSALTTGFGWRYVQGSTNGPGTSTSPNQYYALTVGLGNDYNYDNYGMQLVIPRNTATPYISVRFEESRSLGAWQKISAGYADTAGSANAVAWSNVSGKPSTFAPSSHNHDSRYLVKGGSWNGLNMPGSRWGGFSANGGEVVFQQDNPNNGQMSVMVDGNFYAGERNGFWSLYSSSPSHNDYNQKVGFYSNTSGHFLISTSAVYAGGNKVWHAGNDGSGSGLDADTVDGYHASRLFRIDSATRSGANFTDLIPSANETFLKELHQIETGVDYPAGAYTYGLLQSTKMTSMKLQWYVPHTASRGDNNTTDTIYFRTGWGADQMYGWKYLIHSGNIAGQSVNYANSAGAVAWGNVTGKPSTFSPSSHTHDDRYYTETEIDTKLATKLATTHDMSLTLGGDATGAATFTNMGNATLSVSVNNDSHTHKAENVTGGILGQSGRIAIANHPEGGALLTPSFENDLAFIVERGGTVTTYITDATDYTRLELNNLGASGFSNTTPFNGSTNYTYASLPSASSVVVYDIEMPFSLSYGNTWYVDFGAGAWQAKDVTFLAFHTDTNNSEQFYKVVGSTFSGVNSGLKFTSGSYSYIRTSDGGRSYSYNRLRVVMGNWDRTGVRIAAIGAKYYNSGSLTATLMSRGGGTMYGNLDVTGTVSATGGNSTNWNTAYGWGNHASAGYAPSAHSHNYITNNPSGTESSSLHTWDRQESTPDLNPTTDWFNALRIGHGNPVTYYSNTLAIQMTGGDLGRIYTRTISNGTKQSWNKYWHGGDFSSTNISNWNTAYGWGNHAVAGYVTSVTDALGYTPYQEGTALSTTTISATNKITLNGGHSTARVVIKYNHNGDDTSENSGNLVMWTSEPGISYASSGIGGNIHESGHYYGKRNANIPYGVALRFNVASGRAEFLATNSTNDGSFGVGWYVDDRGNTVQQGSITAPGYNSGNWDTAYGWGNHASAGYLTSVPNIDASKITSGTLGTARIPNLAASKITSGTFANARISQSSVTQHQGALSIAASQVTGLSPGIPAFESGNDTELSITRIDFSNDEGAAIVTLSNGSQYRLGFAR